MGTPPRDIIDVLHRMQLLTGGTPMGEPLAGGVSSDIWQVDLPTGPICVKRALPKLRVAADWQAPVERNLYEARWMRAAGRAVSALEGPASGRPGGRRIRRFRRRFAGQDPRRDGR